MTKKEIDINPSVTVHRLLESYPELEEVLIGIAPPFKKLRNPVLRRSVAKVATLKHVSSVGGVPLNELIATLRKAVGQTETSEEWNDEDYFGEQPDWFSEEKITLSIDEAKLEASDRMTLAVILEKSSDVRDGEIIELVTTFLPAPGIDVMRSKDYSVWTTRAEDGVVRTYFLKPDKNR